MIFETWFLFAISSAVVGGISFFTNKYASVKNHDPELSVLYGIAISLCVITCATLLLTDMSNLSVPIVLLGLILGTINALAALLKMNTLKHLDVTIFLPLQKVFGPILILIVGIFLFGESFTNLEWIGMGVGLLVPLLLINKAENARQSNLLLGCGFVLVIALLATTTSSLGKISVDIAQDAWWVATTANLGMLLGSVLLFLINKRKESSYKQFLLKNTSVELVMWSALRGITRIVQVFFFFFALIAGGKFVLVSFINSLYILIPIILSILIYKEHLNIKKILAIGISLVSLYFLG